MIQYYKPTPLEEWINEKYQTAGIRYASQMDIELIAAIFGIEIRLYDGPSFAEWDKGSYAFIFLNDRDSQEKRRNVFFHELCHPLRHCGCQEQLPEAFVELQEVQASHFELYAAMPIYLIEEFASISETHLSNVLAEEFKLPESFVRKRLDQIRQRVYWGQREHERRERLAAPPVKIDNDHVRKVIEQWKQKRGVINA